MLTIAIDIAKNTCAIQVVFCLVIEFRAASKYKYNGESTARS